MDDKWKNSEPNNICANSDTGTQIWPSLINKVAQLISKTFGKIRGVVIWTEEVLINCNGAEHLHFERLAVCTLDEVYAEKVQSHSLETR